MARSVDGRRRLPTLPGAAVAIVLAAAGYPGGPATGDPIDGLDAAAPTGALVFHAGDDARRRRHASGRPAGGS